MEPEVVVMAEGDELLGSPVFKKRPVTMDSYRVPVVFDRDAQRQQQSEVEGKGK